MTKKLSPSMQTAMDALPLTYTTWGGQVWGHSFPKGVSIATIRALEKRGLVKIYRDGLYNHRKVVKK